MRSGLLILDLKESKLLDSGKEEGKKFHRLQVFEMNGDLWYGVLRLCRKI